MNDKEIIQKYSQLIQNEKTAREFSDEYLDEFIEEDGEFSEETYQILQNMFAEAEAYCEDPDRRGQRDIEEAELRRVATEIATK
ncbi:colicin immunity domain-containing protein [Haloferax larsenii]|uniref:Self-protective colicin-like immunity n=1 Tax=Haloferax larsenii TaxID=302484 RepID=A0A1H7GD13_HALLR|nr:colicin immunity domain-containing protein [Haloferax larsenii]SEK34370.1 self-protective colicin-like immunity [Haloferax larsenii]